MDAEQFRQAGRRMIDYIADYLENIRERPVLPSVEPFYLEKLIPSEAPEEGELFEEIFKDIERVIMPGTDDPLAFSTLSRVLSDMLSGALACIGFTWIASPACTELEMVMMDWLAKMIDLPKHFMFSSRGKVGGVIQGTASEATLVTLLAARNKILAKFEESSNCDHSGCNHANPFVTETKETAMTKLVAYANSQSHSSVERAALLGGVNIRLLDPDESLSLRGTILETAIEEDKKKGLIPFFVVATLGTTSTCAVDNLEEIGEVTTRHELWLHVDAAYAGSSFVCPEFRHWMRGIEYADSFNMNPHKWLLVNFDCSTLWIKDASFVVDSFNVNPVYLRHSMQGKVPDYRHWQIPLGRRFRSLKVWFVFRSFGVRGLQAHIRKQVDLAKYFESLVKSDNRFEVVYLTELGLVCFRLIGSNEINQRLNQFVNENKIVHITPTKVNDRFILRFAVCARTTERHDIEFAWNEIKKQTNRVLTESP